MSCQNETTTATLNATLVYNCDPEDKLWWVFMLSSIVTLIGGLLLVGLGRLIAVINKRFCRRRPSAAKKRDEKKKKNGEAQGEIGCVTAAKDWAGELISGQTNSGRILVSLSTHFTQVINVYLLV